MSTFAHRCGVHNAAREAACLQTAHLIEASGTERVRLGWCDAHGMLRGKTLLAHAAIKALRDGAGMVGTMMLKDSSDRTAWKVFEAGGADDLPGFAGAANLMLLPDPTSFTALPWQAHTGWLRCQPWFADGTPVPLDTRRVLQGALARLLGLPPVVAEERARSSLNAVKEACFERFEGGRLGVANRIPPIANLVVSNVPGPPMPFYLAGARLKTYWPVSIIEHGLGLNITLQSYAGSLDFGLIAARSGLPDLHRVARGLLEAFAELEAAPPPVSRLEANGPAPR